MCRVSLEGGGGGGAGGQWKKCFQLVMQLLRIPPPTPFGFCSPGITLERNTESDVVLIIDVLCNTSI